MIQSIHKYLCPQARAIAAGLACAGAASGQPTITNLGVLPGWDWSSAIAANGDGSVVVGIANSVNRAFRWTRAGGMVDISAPGSTYPGGTARGASADGSVVVGSDTFAGFLTQHAFRWTIAGGMQDLGTLPDSPTLPGPGSRGFGVSRDGSVVVGDSSSFAGGRAFRWTNAGGMVDLGTLPGASASYARGVSGDGSVIVGYCIIGGVSRACRWTAAEGWTDLGTLPGGNSASATGVSADGSVIVGASAILGGDARGFRWTSAGGMTDLGTVAGASGSSAAAGVSADGNIVVGFTYPAPIRPTLWTASLGTVDLQSYLSTLGTNLTGWTLGSSLVGISADGATIVGQGTFNGSTRGWAVNLDPDTDGDGLRDSWEVQGIPYVDAAGVPQRYPLPSADRFRKDIYVEADVMQGRSPNPAALQAVIDAFDQAPVAPPAGAPAGSRGGIALHIVGLNGVGVDDTVGPATPWPISPPDGPWPLFDVIKNGNPTVPGDMGFFGTVAERETSPGVPDPSWPAKREAKRKAFRYCIFADQFVGDTLSGLAENTADPNPGLGGNDFIITLGGWGALGLDWRVQAGTFMHELGHTLGLKHGGGDDLAWKPNYKSVMNYAWQTPQCGYESSWRLEYSDQLLAPLNESSGLRESIGVGGIYPGMYFPYSVIIGAGGGTPITCTGVQPLCTFVVPGLGTLGVRLAPFGTTWVDWDNNNSQTPDVTSAIVHDIRSTADCQGNPTTITLLGPTTLVGFKDWPALRYDFSASPYFPEGVHPLITGAPDLELTLEMHETLNLVPAPGCYANCDGSTTAPVLNVLDFSCFLNRFAAGDTYANCDGSTTPPVLNVLDFSCFLNAFAAGCP